MIIMIISGSDNEIWRFLVILYMNKIIHMLLNHDYDDDDHHHHLPGDERVSNLNVWFLNKSTNYLIKNPHLYHHQVDDLFIVIMMIIFINSKFHHENHLQVYLFVCTIFSSLFFYLVSLFIIFIFILKSSSSSLSVCALEIYHLHLLTR